MLHVQFSFAHERVSSYDRCNPLSKLCLRICFGQKMTLQSQFPVSQLLDPPILKFD